MKADEVLETNEREFLNKAYKNLINPKRKILSNLGKLVSEANCDPIFKDY